MIRLFKALWEAINYRRICDFCGGTGWVNVHGDKDHKEHLRCVSCSGVFGGWITDVVFLVIMLTICIGIVIWSNGRML